MDERVKFVKYFWPTSFKKAVLFAQNAIAWKVSKYGVVSGPYFPVFGVNTGKYGPEKTLYSETFLHSVH